MVPQQGLWDPMDTHLPAPSLAVLEDFLGARKVQHLANVLGADAVVSILHTISDVFSDSREQLLNEELVAFSWHLPFGQIDLGRGNY